MNAWEQYNFRYICLLCLFLSTLSYNKKDVLVRVECTYVVVQVIPSSSAQRIERDDRSSQRRRIIDDTINRSFHGGSKNFSSSFDIFFSIVAPNETAFFCFFSFFFSLFFLSSTFSLYFFTRSEVAPVFNIMTDIVRIVFIIASSSSSSSTHSCDNDLSHRLTRPSSFFAPVFSIMPNSLLISLAFLIILFRDRERGGTVKGT